MKRSLLAALFLIGGCTDLIGPEDPRYEELCVIYVAENASANVPKEAWDRCLSVQIVVVKVS